MVAAFEAYDRDGFAYKLYSQHLDISSIFTLYTSQTFLLQRSLESSGPSTVEQGL
jgi:hypothetical protein